MRSPLPQRCATALHNLRASLAAQTHLDLTNRRWLQLSLSGISSVEQLTATILQRLGLGAGGLVLLYEDADFDEFLALTEMSELPENANVKLVPSVSGAQFFRGGMRGLT